MAPYPTKSEIEELCSHLSTSNPAPFFDHVSPNVVWDVMGTHPAAGHFTDLESWKKSALGTVNKCLSKPLQLQVRNVCGGGEQEWACVELMADSVAKNGMDYRQRYSWVMRFDKQGTIVEVCCCVAMGGGDHAGTADHGGPTDCDAGACILGLCTRAASCGCEFLIPLEHVYSRNLPPSLQLLRCFRHVPGVAVRALCKASKACWWRNSGPRTQLALGGKEK